LETTPVRLVRSLLATSALSLFLTGCAVNTISTKTTATPPGTTPAVTKPLTGHIRGGQNPIVGAHVYLFEVTPGTYGSQSTSLLKNTGNTDTNNPVRSYVLTNSSGGFSVAANQYSCDQGDQVYLYSVGGDTGFGTNVHAALMAVVGQCGSGNSFSPAPSGPIQMNEVTTVAAAYALAGYAEDATDISGNINLNAMSNAGLANAAANAAVLASIGTGLALTPGVNGTDVQKEVNTLANMLAACINSNGAETGPPSPTPCYQLLTAGTLQEGNAGLTATDTATEAIYIAHNPSFNTALYNLGSATGPFQPVLNTAPNDWTLAVTYTANSLNGATDLAIDATGNIWITNNDPCSSGPPPGNIPIYCITELGPQGQDLSGPTGYIDPSLNKPYGIAIDLSTPGNIWISNNNTDTNSPTGTALTELTPATATTVTAAGFADTNLGIPWGIAVDGFSGAVWIADNGNNILSLYEPGNGFQDSPQNSGGLSTPAGVALDLNGNVWVANPDGHSGDTISEFTGADGLPGQTGNPAPGTPYTIGTMPEKPAVDPSGYIWVANYGGQTGAAGSVSKVDPNTGNDLQDYTGGGIAGAFGSPYGLAVDSQGNIWVANYGPNELSDSGSITELDPTGSPLSPNGFQNGLGKADSIAIDASGNVWVVNNGDGTVTELVGAAAPTITPASNATVGQLP
jgi:sugar lactone lactonase YvrE